MDRAVVLLSGGINSAVAAAVAREQYEPALLHVAWGHRTAERELAAFEHLAGALRISRTFVADLSCMASFGGNARVSKRTAIDDANALGKGIPATFALGLMPSMLSLAAAWADSVEAHRIIVGIGEDYGLPGISMANIYPDYRHEFVQVFNLMLEYAKPATHELVVEAPFIDLTRPEVIKLGSRLGVPWDKTWSCYRNNDAPCGRCLPCVNRANGFLKAGTPDPLMLLEPAAK
jgi:7-cyano-7-deazaguanine synthase